MFFEIFLFFYLWEYRVVALKHWVSSNFWLILNFPLLAVRSEKKRLRKPSKWLLEYTEEYDQIFAPKKKQKKVQEQVHKVYSNISTTFHQSFLGFCNFAFSIKFYLHGIIISLTGILFSSFLSPLSF